MNHFIELTEPKHDTRLTINVSFIIKIQPEKEGCIITLNSGVNCASKESYIEVLKLINASK